MSAEVDKMVSSGAWKIGNEILLLLVAREGDVSFKLARNKTRAFLPGRNRILMEFGVKNGEEYVCLTL